MVISAADAMCMNDEDKWGMRAKYEWKDGGRVQIGEVQAPFYQLRSMAQTRACAKALRNVLAWVVVLAGYKPTPAEEMAGVEAGNGSNEPSCPSCGKKGAIIKGKEEYGGGYLCYKKKGGCGAKFKDLPKQVLEGQPLDQDYGDDPWQDDVPAVNRSKYQQGASQTVLGHRKSDRQDEGDGHGVFRRHWNREDRRNASQRLPSGLCLGRKASMKHLYDIPIEAEQIEIELSETYGELTPELEARISDFIAASKDKVEAAAAVVRSLEANAGIVQAEAERMRQRAVGLQAGATGSRT